MLVKGFRSLHRAVLLLVLTVALTATGFAHRMPGPADAALAFALANGADASDFCGDVGTGDRADALHCQACQITACADLSPPFRSVVAVELAVHAGVVAPRESRAIAVVLDPAHTPQGPPVA